MTEDASIDDEDWGEEELAPAKPAKRGRSVEKNRGGRWRFFAFGAAGGAALLAALALLGGGGGAERSLSPEAAAVFYAPPPAERASGGFGGGYGAPRGGALETGDIRARPSIADPVFSAPPAPVFAEAPGRPAALAPPLWAPPGEAGPAGALDSAGSGPSLDSSWAAGPPRGPGGGPDASSGAGENFALDAPLAPGEPLAPPAPRREGADRDPLGDLDSIRDLEVTVDEEFRADSPTASAAAPAPAPRPPRAEAAPAPPRAPTPAPAPEAPAAAEGLIRAGTGAPLDTPAPKARPPRAQESGASQDPDVYSPGETGALSAPASGARGGWGARLRLDDGTEVALAKAAPAPVHDPGPPSAALLTATGPVYDPVSPTPAPAASPAAPNGAASSLSASRGSAVETGSFTPMISASVEFGPELSPEDFAALDVAADALETGELPRVRAAPIDRPDDGPFSARSETPSAAPAPRRRAAGPVLPKDSPRATVVLTALGLHEAVTLRAMRETPEEVALAFAPIGRRIGERVANLRAEGRVALVEAPMEAMSRVSTPEEITLSTGVSAQENQARLERVLAAAPQASGIATYMGARFTADAGALSGVLPLLSGRGLIVLENQPTNRSRLRGLARESGLRYAAAPVALDRDRGAEAIRAALARLERQALADGEAVGVMAVSNEALDALALWSEGLASRGVRLAPLGEALE